MTARSMPGAAPEFFGAIAKDYDDLIARCVPLYSTMLDRLVSYLPASAVEVLELGCGTGNLTARLVSKLPDASLRTVDASVEMAQATRARTSGRAQVVVSRFEDLAFEPASFDLVVSSISLHHVADKAAMFTQIGLWTRPGGELWIADQFAGATQRSQDFNWDTWLAHCRRPGSCNEDEIRELLDHAAAHDHYVSIPEHGRMLAAAGFDPDSIDCVWRDLIWGILGARRL